MRILHSQCMRKSVTYSPVHARVLKRWGAPKSVYNLVGAAPRSTWGPVGQKSKGASLKQAVHQNWHWVR